MSLVKIKDLFHFEKGSLQSTKATPGDYDFITAAADWKTHNEFTHDCEALIFAAAASGSLGRTHYVNGKFISSDLCFILTPKDEEKYPIDIKFYHLIFNAFKDEIVRNTKAGTSKEAIGLTVFGNYKLPYFEIEKQQETKEAFLRTQEVSQSLDNELSKQLELIKILRQAFLKDAIQGKLTAQIQSHEHASEILEKIKVHKHALIELKKIKKEKPLPVITEEEIPFEIPESWSWGRLGDICETITKGSSPNWQGVKYVDSYDKGILFITSKNVDSFKIDLTNSTFVESKFNEIEPRSILQKGDLLTNIVGASIGRTALYELDFVANINQAVCILRFDHEYINKNYLLYLMNSEFVIELMLKMQFAPGRANLSMSNIANFPIPVPPLKVQKQIVDRIEEIFLYCSKLENTILFSQNHSTMLLQQSLREALGLKSSDNQKIIQQSSKLKYHSSKYDSNTLLMEIQELLKIHGKLQALELWQMSKFYGKSDDERNIDGFYAELKKLIEKDKLIKEAEKGYLELV
ncbi:MAG: restriction endonuclease subunit S [Bacteroidia bacterium]|nr:restriction endonuclease subunit S [Bacteroidia bacterium]